MSTYAFKFITVNGREIALKDIIEKAARPLSEFEASTFTFIQHWFTGNSVFTQNTSGSTGAPKPIQITRQQMISSAALTRAALGLEEGETALVCLDTAFIAGKMMLVRSFTGNLKIVVVNPSANPLKQISDNVRVDFVALVPHQLYEILHSSKVQRLNAIKNIIIGGAALNDETKKNLSLYQCRCYATYGMTETVSHVALQPLNGPTASPYFSTLPTIQIGYDRRKCLIVDAPYLSEKIITNDLVEIIDDQHFKWLGRFDNIINTGGYKVIPEKVESDLQIVFNEWKIHNPFLIASVPDPKFGNKIVLLFNGEIQDWSTDELLVRLKEKMRPYERPKEIHTHMKFVYTKNGKVNRKETLRLLQF